MLQEIYINNFVLIDELRLELLPGLNVLTGETGAGKSIIIDALGLVIGDRITNDFVKDNQHKAVVEAVFDVSCNNEARIFLQENGLLEDDGLLILSREITPGGRNIARINGRSVNVSALKNIAVNLLDMHLQHDHLSILRPDMYLKYVDGFSPGSGEILPLVKAKYYEMRNKKNELQQLESDEMNKRQKSDFLTYQIEEIEKAQLHLGEEEELTNLAHRIRNSRKLLEGSERLYNLLYDGPEARNAYDLISMSVNTCSEMGDEPFFVALQEQLQEVYYLLQDKSAEISSYRDSLDFEPGLQEEVEERIYVINKLKSKYGNSIGEILDFLKNAREEKLMLDNSQERKGTLLREIEKLQEEYSDLADRLSEKRKQGALILRDMVNKELIELNMPDIRFEVLVEDATEVSSSGQDKIGFLFSANPGESMRPISHTASGGEISRFVLALKKALAAVYQVPTLIFDEIDIGVGGTSLTAMALKIRELASSHQVVLVTHSPQVASYASQHCLIAKQIVAGKTSTIVKTLGQDEKIKEIARMLGGDNYSELTLEHAREMYTLAQTQPA
ncbi:dna repair protein recn [hydrocarbon metagenome]|uniref:DNA repair protein RecN n=1 Tax=hydrocarbon metagenome TaxID=938273 RepID=A0A0W8E918_9ZZZZ